ncbi:stage III sporulation protein AH [Gracilibacillus halotolerans]|uniref:Stage III sporulation protein AH n=1 Tax=Gracilibacillus halotolerans TaxID=74386 RepID=A0A841RJU4_9BACI|nr:SpoIIIAH-like family protein [Gracilibacillus halotolerans]MBB6511756.1 stage III sporulation protein AH [Gracilibacillus halotolerans]
MLKKQTVWLLTMLSLMIVLSVYYINAPTEGDLAYVDSNQNEDEALTTKSLEEFTGEEVSSEETEGDTEENSEENVETATQNRGEHFTAVRMELTNQRSMEKERLDTILSSNEASSTEKNEAYEAMKNIELVESKESIVEETLKSIQGYNEVLVRNVSDDNVVVTVETDTLTPQEANQIIQKAKEEFGEINIEVQYHTS